MICNLYKQCKKKNNLGGYLFRTLLFAVLLLTMLISADAIPTPHGIDGYVLTDNGTAQSPAGTSFSIKNLETGSIIQGQTGMGSYTGRYSASLTGLDGDHILIQAWNENSSVNRTVNLSGSMHNVNLILPESSEENPMQTQSMDDMMVLAVQSKSPSDANMLPQEETSTAVDQVVGITGILLDGEATEDDDIVVRNLRTGEVVYGRRGQGGTFSALLSGTRGDQIRLEYKKDTFSNKALLFEELVYNQKPLLLSYASHAITEQNFPDVNANTNNDLAYHIKAIQSVISTVMFPMVIITLILVTALAHQQSKSRRGKGRY